MKSSQKSLIAEKWIVNSSKLTGTLSVVILAKQYGLIESAAQVLRALQNNEFRLDNNVIREALARTVGENW